MTREELATATDEQLNQMAAKMMHRVPLIFRPSTSIADAWELVEKMRVLYGFNLDASGFDGAEWRVVIGWGDDPISVHVEAATAPRAITTAALLAWGEKA